MITTNKCPNCRKTLKKIPGKTTNCVFCGKRIYVRTKVKDRKKVLVDLEGVKQIDNEWTKYALRSNWFKVLKRFGVVENDYMIVHDELTKRWGFNPKHRDIFWSLFNNILLDSFRKGDTEKSKLIQKYMEKFKSEEKRFGGRE